MKTISRCLLLFCVLTLAACNSSNPPPDTRPTASAAARPAAKLAIRIDVGAAAPFTDADGNVWLAHQGFADGTSVDRGDIPIEGTKNPGLYRTEHYRMSAFTMPAPNGAYTVKLHFAETYSGVTASGQRVFSVKVEDQEIKDLDIFARAGAARKAVVAAVKVNVSDAKLDIVFTPGTQHPVINAIEIIPD